MTQSPNLSSMMMDTALYPYQVNWAAEQVYLLNTTPAYYETAAFLDQRSIQQGMSGAWVPLAEARAATHDTNAPLGLIFHVGHCGSTLISRALGLLPAFHSLREPLPLRDLADAWVDRDECWSPSNDQMVQDDIAWLRSLWARTPDGKALSVVKATSFCSLLAAPILGCHQQDRAIMLSMAPETYLATILGAGTAYIGDLTSKAKLRMKSLTEATGEELAPLWSLSPGEITAMAYLADMVSMERAAQAAPDRVHRLDFDRYLAAPAEQLGAMARHFGHDVDEESLTHCLRNPVLGRYSKATDYAFSAADRQKRLAEARTEYADDIRTGMAWLVKLARSHDLVASSLRSFGYAK